MKLQNPEAQTDCSELALMREYLDFNDATVLELGCGTARTTRLIAETFPIKQLIAAEVDHIQLQKNLASEFPSTITFKDWGAQAIDLPDNSVDIVLMFKSLHHVPNRYLKSALAEVARVLKSGGKAWILEPVYAGEFNEVIRLFHDEKQVREAAFQAIQEAVKEGLLESVTQIFCNTETRFADFAEFEQRIIKVTHTQHRLSDELYQTVKQKFATHMSAEGVKFANPIRVDLLRKR
ncbi:MAG: class I SAM-dependent methyltransferase [Thiofilum sp.]|uniref:class I SAM-dependent methyltransferase n=1 Tax=Thiofilum sp. TaxID=2212733 RepID=UPI0025D6FAAA|nr:class I SAM-dependent methyltransferase [Thiofilum sp.]MBK8455537.1 class I SAM-dependent methyltransferase [Thiofilum sp.]